jgi:coenzyme Q-binding protein COQ10
MASAQTEEIFDCSVEEFYKIITDYPNYSKFLSEVKKCEVIESKGDTKLVEYSVSVVKSFKYRLKIKETANKSIAWKFDSGEIFKTCEGSWTLKAEGKKCKATYAVEATFGVFVPGPIAKALVSVNLPGMMSAYKKRIKELYK